MEAVLPEPSGATKEDPAPLSRLQVRIASDEPTPQMAGTYSTDGAFLRFHPAFPLQPGLHYVATLHLDPTDSPAVLSSPHLVPRPAPGPPTVVSRITPSADLLPLNLLKFYLHFSAPMTRGSAYEHITLRTKDGTPVQDPFLELPEELWDPGMTRLTVLLDPGRIKRGLLPNEVVGSVFEEGHDYTLTVSAAWLDASGQALKEPFEKKFRAAPADYTQPDPATWSFLPPAANSRDPLRIEFPEPLDAALVSRLLTIRDPAGNELAGEVTLPESERVWLFHPAQNWRPHPYQLHIDHRIEDLAGNSIERRFEEALDRHPAAVGDQPGQAVREFVPRVPDPAPE